MRPIVAGLFVASLCAPSALLLGCFTESPAVLEDTQGNLVDWECRGGDCDAVPRRGTTEPPACGGEGDERWVVGAGAVAILCAASDVASDLVVHEATCRPLACHDELDCPQWEDLVYGCDGGVCTTAALALDPLDVRAVCLRNVPRLATCDAQASDETTRARDALALEACPSAAACTIPDACRE